MLVRRAVGEHGVVREELGDAGKLRGSHGSVASAVSAGRGGGEDRHAAPGSGLQRLLHVLRAAGRLRAAHHRRQGECRGKPDLQLFQLLNYFFI